MNEWEKLDKEYVWHPFTQMKGWQATPQIVIERGEGVLLFDTEGRAYYDGVSSLWVNIHGHRRQEIDKAIKEQLDKIAHTTLLGLTNKPAAEFAAMLIEAAPSGLGKVFYSDDGSTAVEAGVKIAYQYWQNLGLTEKQEFISLSDAYHGDTVGAVSVGNIDVFHKVYKPLLFNTKKLTCPSFIHCDGSKFVNEEAFLSHCLDELDAYLRENAAKTAAMIIEPLVQAAAGMLVQPKGYVRGVREITKKHNVLLIADEVATGFGRTGRMWACDHEGVVPDLMALSKGITGGYLPLGATLVTNEIYQAFCGNADEGKTFFHGHSYTGNPLACAAGIASLKIFEKEAVLAGLAKKIDIVAEYLEKLKPIRHVGHLKQCGMIVGIELMLKPEKKISFPPHLLMGARVCGAARSHGLIVRNIGDVVTFMPPLASSEEDLMAMLRALEQALLDTFETQGFEGEKQVDDSCAF